MYMTNFIKRSCLLLYMSMVVTLIQAYDIEAKNSDGITIYYNFINDGEELSVTKNNNQYAGNIVIPSVVTYQDITRRVTAIEDYAFSRCSDLLSVSIPNSVTTIGRAAFQHCSALTSLIIPNSVTTIDDYSFFECSSLTSVAISNRMVYMGECAFAVCSSLTSINIPNSVKYIGGSIFAECKSLTSVTISNKLSTISAAAFSKCSSLISVEIPNSVTSIGDVAFSGCSSLSSIIIPNSVINIDGYAFYGCSNLTSVTIPESVNNIGPHAFFGCSKLSSVISMIIYPCEIYGFYSALDTFDEDVFKNSTLYIPTGTLYYYKTANGWKDFVHIKEGIPSSINSYKSNDKELDYYNMYGKHIIGPKQGVNIIRTKDGKAKKVILK